MDPVVVKNTDSMGTQHHQYQYKRHLVHIMKNTYINLDTPYVFQAIIIE